MLTPFEQFNTSDRIEYDGDTRSDYPLMTLYSLTMLRPFPKHYRRDGGGGAIRKCVMCVRDYTTWHWIVYAKRVPEHVATYHWRQMGICNSCWMEGRMAIPLLQPRYTKEIQESTLSDILIQDVLNIVIEYASLDTHTMIYLPYDDAKIQRSFQREANLAEMRRRRFLLEDKLDKRSRELDDLEDAERRLKKRHM